MLSQWVVQPARVSLVEGPVGEPAAEGCALVQHAAWYVKEGAMFIQAVDLTDLEIVEESAVQSATITGGFLCGIGCDGLICGLWCGR